MRRLSFLLLLTIGYVMTATMPAATLSMQPATTTVGLGQIFSLNIGVSGVTDLFAFQFDVGFDPSILSAQTITEGPFLQAGGPTFFLPGIIDNAGGTISGTAASLSGPVAGVSGTGVLAVMTFQMLVGTGQSPVNFFGVTLLDSNLFAVDATIGNGTVTASVPEPGTIAMVVCSVLLFAFLRRRSWL